MRRILLLLSLGFFCTVAAAEERVAVCYNYGCYRTDVVVFSEAQLAEIHQLLSPAKSAEQERKVLALAVGRLLGWAGQQSPISADRGGNVEDAGVFGRMDCIDHSTTTTRLLKVLEGRRWLRWHQVTEPVLRTRFLIFDHWSAAIEERISSMHYVVDSWFYDNGQPAVVMPLDDWMEWLDEEDLSGERK